MKTVIIDLLSCGFKPALLTFFRRNTNSEYPASLLHIKASIHDYKKGYCNKQLEMQMNIYKFQSTQKRYHYAHFV